MNDDHYKNMIKALADAFDRAAIKCSTKEYAAKFIQSELEDKGFAIVMKAKTKAKA